MLFWLCGLCPVMWHRREQTLSLRDKQFRLISPESAGDREEPDYTGTHLRTHSLLYIASHDGPQEGLKMAIVEMMSIRYSSVES